MLVKNMLNTIIASRRIVATDGPTSLGLLLLRLWVGLIMALSHGWAKLTTYGERADQFPDPLGVGSPVSLGLTIFAEFFCALAFAAGLFTRAVAIPLIITMVVAAFVIHGDDPFGKKELALLFAAPFVAVFVTGPGRYSLDRLIAGTLTNETPPGN